MKRILALVAVATVLTACDQRPETSTQIERRNQEDMSLQAVQSVGMPAITNIAE